MKSVRSHYEEFLASIYSWIIGDFDSAYRKYVKYFDTVGLRPAEGALAVDLGCGPGCQSLPLAEIGFRVLAIDFSPTLLEELSTRTGSLPITAVQGDIVNFSEYLDDSAELIVCMGDTLVHLPDVDAVSSLIDSVAAALKPGGLFIYAIRDYVDAVPEGAARFVPIRSDEERIFTCFLDYHEDTVHVHDLLHRKTADGWQLRISDYRKLRLDTAEIDRRLVALGFSIEDRRIEAGMITVVARKPR
jgi:SAM-dependent methyltransferase